MSTDTQLRGLRWMRQHIEAYLTASKALSSASDRASQASVSRNSEARRSAYNELRDYGAAARLAERRMIQAAHQLAAYLPAAEIEKLALSLDKRDTPDSPAVIIRAALTAQ